MWAARHEDGILGAMGAAAAKAGVGADTRSATRVAEAAVVEGAVRWEERVAGGEALAAMAGRELTVTRSVTRSATRSVTARV